MSRVLGSEYSVFKISGYRNCSDPMTDPADVNTLGTHLGLYIHPKTLLPHIPKTPKPLTINP